MRVGTKCRINNNYTGSVLNIGDYVIVTLINNSKVSIFPYYCELLPRDQFACESFKKNELTICEESYKIEEVI